ncbi:unnamed protein product [Heterobilharzia americana]|nr:unnamed protein product [Heterobilharzia americana]
MRIYPAKDKLTQQNRGFAFISYETPEQASNAIYAVNGLRHNHVVLKVDWAKKRRSSLILIQVYCTLK